MSLTTEKPVCIGLQDDFSLEQIATEILSSSRVHPLTILLEGLDRCDLNIFGNYYSFLDWKSGPAQLITFYVALNIK